MQLNSYDTDLIESYFRNEIQPDQRARINMRLACDEELAATVNFHRQTISAIQSNGRRALKASLAALGSELAQSGEWTDYTPESVQKSRNGSKAGYNAGRSTFMTLLGVAGLAAAAYFIWGEPDAARPWQAPANQVQPAGNPAMQPAVPWNTTPAANRSSAAVNPPHRVTSLEMAAVPM